MKRNRNSESPTISIIEPLEPRVMLSADSCFELGSTGYAYLADANVADLDYSKDFSVESIVNIEPYTPAGRWGGLVTKTGTYGLYDGSAG